MNRYCYECKKDDTITVIDMKDGEEYNLPTPEVLGYLDYLTNSREIKSKIDTCKELNNRTSYIDVSGYDELDFTEVTPDTHSHLSFRGKDCYIKPSHKQECLELSTCNSVLDLTNRSNIFDTLFVHPTNTVKFPKKSILNINRLSVTESDIKHSGRLKGVSELYYSGTVAEFNKLVKIIDKIKELKAVIFHFDGGGKKSANLKIPKQLENKTFKLNAHVTAPRLKLTLDLQNQEFDGNIHVIFEQCCPLENRASFEIDVIVQNVNCKTRQDFKKLEKCIVVGMQGRRAKRTTYLTKYIEIPKNLIGEVRADCQNGYVSEREEYSV